MMLGGRLILEEVRIVGKSHTWDHFTMKQVMLAMVAVLFAAFPLQGQGEEKNTGPMAERAKAVVQEIEIVRRKGEIRARSSEAYMRLEFWFPAVWKAHPLTYSIKLTRLDPVVDDTGKVLLTSARRADIEALSGEVRYDGTQGFGGKEGPTLKLVLDAPARRATALKAIKGRAEVSRVTSEIIKVDLAAVVGKPLRHKWLGDFHVQPRIVAETRVTEVILQVPSVHGRLIKWDVKSAGRRLKWFGQGVHAEAGGRELVQMYAGKLPKGCSLVLKITTVAETKVFDFNFPNVEMP
jgi:hypothetical protein